MKDCMLDVGLMAMLCSVGATIWTQPSLASFLTLATGWVLCRSRRTTSGLIVAAGALGRKHFGSYHRFFGKAAWTTRRFWLGILRTVVESLCPAGELVLVGDDTVQRKSGKKISGAANWRNACGSTRQEFRFLWGLNWVILGLAVEFSGKTFCLPINLRLYRKRQGCPGGDPAYRTRSELMWEMVEEVLRAFPERSVVLLVDGQYAGRKLLGKLSGCNAQAGPTAITRLRRDAALYLPPPQRRPGAKGRAPNKGKRLPTPEQIAERKRWPWTRTAGGREVKSLVVLWYSVLKGRPVRLVITKQKNPREPYAYFLCTDPSWDADRILSTYRARWTIEITVRNARQHGGLGDAQCRRPLAVERQATFTLAMMTLVMTWYMSEGHRTHAIELPAWYRQKNGATFLDIVTHARRTSLLQLISARSGPNPDLTENADKLLSYLQAAA